jgi:hypothetical protein
MAATVAGVRSTVGQYFIDPIPLKPTRHLAFRTEKPVMYLSGSKSRCVAPSI